MIIAILRISFIGYRSSLNTQQQQPLLNNCDEDDRQLQRAIHESLKQKQQQQQPPSYGWNIPPDLNRPPLRTQQQHNILYSDTPSQFQTSPSEHRSSPTAPPLSDINPSYPSPLSHWSAPYPRPQVEDSEMIIEHGFDGEKNLNNIRSARLRRFESKN